MSEIEQTVKIEVTPKIMADAFWNMGSDQQADFFAELAKLTKDDQFHAQMQWLAMSQEIAKSGNKDSIECFLSFTGFAYDYWPQKTESQFVEM